jgi:hypothetical protein
LCDLGDLKLVSPPPHAHKKGRNKVKEKVKRDPRRKKKKQKIVSCNLSNSIQRIWVIIMVGLGLGQYIII